MNLHITTERLRLHPLNEADIPFLQTLAARPETYRYESDKAKSNEEVNKQCLWYMERAYALPDEGAVRWIVQHQNIRTGEVHVTCNWEETREWEIGYAFLSEHWGNGYAMEAVKAVIAYAFTHFNINRLAAFVNAENTKSAALLQRAGMQTDGRMRETRLVNGVYYDEYVFSILKKEFNG